MLNVLPHNDWDCCIFMILYYLCSINNFIYLVSFFRCGKSTQIPQFILDHPIHGPACNMVVTQPRRISAISLADRVAAERCEEVGDKVGFIIRSESKSSSETQCMFMTTGVLLRRLIGDPTLRDLTHIIVDEIHERDINSDFLLVILRDLLAIRNDLKVGIAF